MFLLIEFENIDNDDTKNTMYQLNSYPNGTILSHSQYIKVTNLPSNKRIVWLDKRVSEYNSGDFLALKSMKGVQNCIELENIETTIHSDNWLWDDDYINSIFENKGLF